MIYPHPTSSRRAVWSWAFIDWANSAFAIVVYAGVCLFAARMDSQREFFIIAVVIGLVQGGVQSLSRSYFARLIPPDKGGEFFGFYNMLGKFASVLGPTLMGVTALLTDSRTSILSLLLLFGGGLWLLTRVREPAGRSHLLE